MTFLVHGLKHEVLKRIARCTKAEVLPSADGQFVKPRLGTCGSFRTEVVSLLNGDKKPLMFFEECQPDLACTVLLYGNNDPQLRAAKRVVKFVISVLYSAKLEVAMLRMYHACADKERNTSLEGLAALHRCQVCMNNTIFSTFKSEIQNAEQSEFMDCFSQAVFSVSPFIDYGVPFLETSAGQKCAHINYFKQKPLYRFKTKCESWNGADVLPLNKTLNVPVTDKTTHEFLLSKLTNSALCEAGKREIAAYRAQSSKLLKKRFQQSAKEFRYLE